MNHRYRLKSAAATLLVLVLAACGGGRADPPADVSPNPAPPVAASGKLLDFLLFPNPLKQVDGTAQTNTTAYAEAYYKAIDPGGKAKTFEAWKQLNGFGQLGTGTEETAVFGDFRDLGYGRRMTARKSNDGTTIAFFVENYLVDTAGGGYASGPTLDAAVVQDQRWKANINAIEFSPGRNAAGAIVGTVKFAKFYSFDPVTHERRLEQDIDGRGPKALPGLCISCHGGRADALEPPDPVTGVAMFPLLNNSESSQRGDTRGKLHVFEVDSLTFSNKPGVSRSEQQAKLKVMNGFVLCSYPMAAPPAGSCRPSAVSTEWQGAAAELIIKAYGGDALPQAEYSTPAVPAGWMMRPQDELLYRNVVVPACRSCHIVRGTGNSGDRQSEIDLTTFAKFDNYADRTKIHVFDRGNMPLAKIVFDKFWTPTPGGSMADKLAAYLDTKGAPYAPARDAAGQLVKPDLVIPAQGLPTGPVTFTQVKAVLTGPTSACFGCHKVGDAPLTAFNPDDPLLYERVRGMVNLTDVVASPLLRKPSNNHHGGGQVGGFNTGAPLVTNPPGNPLRSDYDLFLNWALAGALKN